ncbi:MAG: diphthamide biosynthesis enzyme Dph2 [Nitrososphaerales archaeon]
MLRIDEEKIFIEIERRRPKVVVFNAPSGLLSKTQDILMRVQEKYNIDAYLIADPCYGICDTFNHDAQRLNADIIFHIGHTSSMDKIGDKTIIIDAYDDISFNEVLQKAIPYLKGYSAIGLCTISQHLHKLNEVKHFLEDSGFKVLIGKGKGRLRDGQVLGCEFHTVYDIKDLVDVFLFLGQSSFHAIGVGLSTNKPIFMLDPYFQEVINLQQIISEKMKKAILAIYKARDANCLGIIIGLREGQMLLNKAIDLKKRLENLGKKVQLIALREIINERLAELQKVDAFIQTACPRISIDGYTFNKPVLSIPQAESLIQILMGGEFQDFLKKPSWL